MSLTDQIAQYLPEQNLEDLTQFRVQEPRAVLRLLTEVVNTRALITLYNKQDFSIFIVSRLLSISGDEIELEIQTEPSRHAAMLEHGSCIVVGFLDQLKIQFEATFVDSDITSTVARCQIPSSVFRIQRRSAYRIRPPVGQDGKVSVRGEPGEEDYFELVDVSATGLSFRRLAQDRFFSIGERLDHARMELGSIAPVPCCIQVRVVIKLQEVIGLPSAWRIGCEFVNMPAEIERAVQVYVQDTERTLRRLRMAPKLA